ncbi:hypothetical protein [Alteromonas sp. BMJM2]|uniref:hypothetical protein n=1 Tax=Alteromonas sp. BMJM2 TaxID=2954241 RepID=UPI0022B573CA|nr:hypothetical protein [Alteromonas sp. BMJM2]
MDSGLLGGIIGGIVSIVLCSVVSTRISHKSNNGQLKFGLIVSILFWVCLFIVLICLYSLIFTDINYDRDLFPIIGLIVGFGLAAVYSFGEAYRVKGRFNSQTIEFHTPWTGSKNEKWTDLESAKFNVSANWYTLTFTSGAKIRLSALMQGHGLVIDHVKSLGYSIK